MRKALVDSGAPAILIEQIDVQMMEKRSVADTYNVEQYKAMKEHDPFRTKTNEQTMFIVGLLPDSDYRKVLWMYKDEIFTYLFSIHPEWYLIEDYMARHKILYEVIKKYMKLNPQREGTSFTDTPELDSFTETEEE